MITRRKLFQFAGSGGLGLGAARLGYVVTDDAHRQNRRLMAVWQDRWPPFATQVPEIIRCELFATLCQI
jgi:hypothetical protein